MENKRYEKKSDGLFTSLVLNSQLHVPLIWGLWQYKKYTSIFLLLLPFIFSLYCSSFLLGIFWLFVPIICLLTLWFFRLGSLSIVSFPLPFEWIAVMCTFNEFVFRNILAHVLHFMWYSTIGAGTSFLFLNRLLHWSHL